MKIVAEKCVEGCCTSCGAPCWRGARAARDNGPKIKAGQWFPLWPMPDSVYAKLETETGFAPGIAFCGNCCPDLGDVVLHGFGPVVAIEAAHARYHSWFTPDHGEFRRAWLRDALSLDHAYIAALMQQWESDRPRVILGR